MENCPAMRGQPLWGVVISGNHSRSVGIAGTAGDVSVETFPGLAAGK